MLVLRPTLSTTVKASAERADIAASASSNVDAATAVTRMFAAVVTPAGQEGCCVSLIRWSSAACQQEHYEMVLGGQTCLHNTLESIPQAVRHAYRWSGTHGDFAVHCGVGPRNGVRCSAGHTVMVQCHV